MNTNQTDALAHEFSNGLQPIILKQRMSPAAVTVNYEGGGIRKCCARIIGPAIRVNHRGDTRDFIEARL